MGPYIRVNVSNDDPNTLGLYVPLMGTWQDIAQGQNFVYTI